MKYIKEINFFKKKDLPDDSYWYIAGDYNTIVKIVKKFLRGVDYDFEKSFRTHEYDSNVVGCYISISKSEGKFGYWTIGDNNYGDVEADHSDAKKYFEKSEECVYMGEIKLDDKGKVYVDTFEPDVKKYNL